MEQPHHCSLHLHHHHCHHHHLLLLHPASHHQHHHHHVLPYFPLNPKLNFCPNLINPPPQIPQPAVPLASHNNPNSGFSGFEVPDSSQDTQNFQDDGLDEFEEVEDEEPIFVMTDEWREFFAKSEARRREAKMLARKHGKT